jgi:hypothetical protein
MLLSFLRAAYLRVCMKIRFNDLFKSMEHLRTSALIKSEDSNVALDLSVSEEDIQMSRLGSSLILTYSETFTANIYESLRTGITREFTIEVFAESENRVPRMTVVETRDLDFNKKN